MAVPQCPPGQAREDWAITVEMARGLGLDWGFTHPSQVFAEMKQGMKSLDNITWDRLEVEGAVTFPSLTPSDPGQPIVFAEAFPRENGRARCTPVQVIAPEELPDAKYPMVLTTSRQLEH